MKQITTRFRNIALGILLSLIAVSGITLPVQAIAIPSPAKAQITFSFDDGRMNAYNNAAPILQKYGLKGTMYAITGCIGMTTTPNKCHADTSKRYMDWIKLKALQDSYGWEIGSHTVSHPYLASFDASDGQPKPLTPAQVVTELSQSKTDLITHGIKAQSFASPYGDYNNFTLKTIAKYYSSHRGFADQNDNRYPYNERLINNFQVQNPVTLTAAKAKVDYAIDHKTWLVMTFHDIVPNPSTKSGDYQWSNSNFEALAAYVQSKQATGLATNVNVTEGTVKPTSNILPHFGMNGVFANGWRTDTPGAFYISSNGNGAFPQASNSIAATGSTAQAHLFSPRVDVSSSSLYALKSYLNASALHNGEIGFYIDEFDANGNWISGQYKGREISAYVENFNTLYQPTSSAVRKASLQIYTTPGSSVNSFIDNIELFSVARDTTAPTNLVQNGAFDADLSTWRSDDALTFTADSSNHGAPTNPVNAVKFSKANGTAHLFSSPVAVSAGASYTLGNYVNITALNRGEVGYYIDEYDANGAWVSGQYKQTVNTIGAQTVSFQYVPSSANVSSSSLQIIVSGTSNPVTGYLDDSTWYKN